jgi:hypothetical protein
MKSLLTAAALAALALTTACSGAKEEAPVETNVVNIVEPENIVVANIVEPTPTPAATNITSAAPTGAEFGDEATTQSDAEAAGMTARVDRGENSAQDTQ